MDYIAEENYMVPQFNEEAFNECLDDLEKTEMNYYPEVLSPPQNIFQPISGPCIDNIYVPGSLSGLSNLAGGSRFRYQSEINKNSCSYLKTKNDEVPEIEVSTAMDTILSVNLVDKHNEPHFYPFYSDRELDEHGELKIRIPYSEMKQTIKLQHIGIKKLNRSESLSKIKKSKQFRTDQEVLRHYEENKNIAKIRAMLLPAEYSNVHTWKIPIIFSDPIKSTSRNEHLNIKIKYALPKEINHHEKNIVIVLEKKLSETTNVRGYFTGGPFKKTEGYLDLEYKDGQTFVFKLPKRTVEIRTKVDFEMKNDKSRDSIPMYLGPSDEDIRKRKNLTTYSNNIPLKRVCISDQQQINSHNQSEQVAEIESLSIRDLEFDSFSNVNSNNNISTNANRSFMDDLNSNIQYDHEYISNDELDMQLSYNDSNSVKNSQDSAYGTSGSNNENNAETTEDESEDDESESEIEESSDDSSNSEEEEVSCYESDTDDSDHADSSSQTDDGSDSELDEDKYECDGRPKRLAPRNENSTCQHIKISGVKAKTYELDIKDAKSTEKILSEVAKVGHDFAFYSEKSAVFERIKTCLPVIFTLQDDVGDTPLHNAILKGNVNAATEILEIVSQHCNWALDLANTSNQTVLCLAPACEMPVSFVQKLLDAGCKLNVTDNLDRSPISYAIQYQQPDTLELLLKYASQNNLLQVLARPQDVYYSVLHDAINDNFVKGVKLLIEFADVNEIGKLRKESALHMAVNKDIDIEIIDLLVNHSEIIINPINSDGLTPYDLAIQKGLTEIAKRLEEFGGDKASKLDIDTASQLSETKDDENDENETEYASSYNRTEYSPNEILMQPESAETIDTMSQSQPSINCQEIIDKMKLLNLKGEIMSEILDVLIKAELTIEQTLKVVKPEVRQLIKSSRTRAELNNNLQRFNCLPKTLEELYDNLRNQTTRKDLVNKIEEIVMNAT